MDAAVTSDLTASSMAQVTYTPTRWNKGLESVWSVLQTPKVQRTHSPEERYHLVATEQGCLGVNLNPIPYVNSGKLFYISYSSVRKG